MLKRASHSHSGNSKSEISDRGAFCEAEINATLAFWTSLDAIFDRRAFGLLRLAGSFNARKFTYFGASEALTGGLARLGSAWGRKITGASLDPSDLKIFFVGHAEESADTCTQCPYMTLCSWGSENYFQATH